MKTKFKISILSFIVAALFSACKKDNNANPSKASTPALSKNFTNLPSSDNWELLPGIGNDIGIGANGSVFITDTTTVSPTGGFRILQWNGTSWTVMTGAAGVRIAVDPSGTPWVVNKSHLIYKYNGSTWTQLPGTATDIGIGANGSVFIT